MDPSPRGKESTPLEQAVSRAVRDNLALVQHTAKELGQAIEDFVAACGSSRNANMLPSMLRAQTAAASLTSMLDVLSRLLTASLQPARFGASEAYVASLAPVAEPVAAPPAPRRTEAEAQPRVAVPPAPPEPETKPVVEAGGGPLVPPETEPEPPHQYVPAGVAEVREAAPEAVVAVEAPPPAAEPVAVAVPPVTVFRVEDLPQEQQELHRRANRHAKVSMQDIYLLRPKDVQAARQNKDICKRLRPDIEKARKEYVRRFGPILEHPVDYFYHWMVEVLAEGKPEVLGEYPYPSAAPRH